MDIAAGRLRHRVTIQAQTRQLTGTEYSLVWADFARDIAAEFMPLSGRDFLQSQAAQSQIVARVTIRYLDGVTSAMRVLYNGDIYKIAGPPLADPEGRRWLTLMVAAGVGDGS